MKDVFVEGVRIHTDTGPGDNVNSPTVWLVADATTLTIIDNIAYITE